MPVPYEVLCNKCSSSLNVAGRSMDYDGDVACEVDPCEKCLEDARDEGRQEAVE